MNKHRHQILPIMHGLFFVLATVLAILLFTEYRFFKQYNYAMHRAAIRYKEYVRTYKNLIAYQLHNQFETKEEDEDSPFDRFVNRDHHYLKKIALEHGKEAKTADKLEELYEGPWLIGPEYHLHADGTLEKKVKQQKGKPARKVAPKPLQLRKPTRGIFVWPIEQSSFWISSRFGPRKKEDGSMGYHYGLDMAAPKGTPVMACAAGKIIEAGLSEKGYGNTVVIAHSGGEYQTRYAHLNSLKTAIGRTVAKGQCIGTVGDTGSVRGKNGGKNAYHLHLEVRRNGSRIDPLSVLI